MAQEKQKRIIVLTHGQAYQLDSAGYPLTPDPMGVLTRRMPSLISGLAVDSLGRGVQRSRTESSRLSSLKFIEKKVFVIIETLLYNKGRLYYK